MPDFQKCASRSWEVAKRLKKIGYNPKIAFGVFTPDNDKLRWDERWRAGQFFSHFWIEIEDEILDYSVEQFGYENPLLVSVTDIRYKVLGYADIKTLQITYICPDRIDFESYTDALGVPKMRLIHG